MEHELRRMFEMKEAEMTVPPTLSPDLRNRIGKQRMVMGGLVAATAVALVFGGIAGAGSLSSDEGLPPADDSNAFVDTWVSTDMDGSTQTMVVRASGGDTYEIVLRDDSATVCSGAPSTMTGTGRLDGDRELVIPSPVLTCDDGTEPQAESGPPLEEQLRNLTFVHDPEADTLADNLGVVWGRAEEKDQSVVDFPDLTATFDSPTNGFSVKHPDGVVPTQGKAKDEWGPENDGPMTKVDVVDAGLSAVFKGASAEIPDVPSPDEWVQALTPGVCSLPPSQQAEITIDGQSGRISECPNQIEATVVDDGRLYFFTLEHDRGDARAIFDAFTATIELTPETAVDVPDPTWVEVQMNMKGTFVSPINGYTFKYLDRGGLEPAKELWDPANQPSPVEALGGYGAEYQNEFDYVETGYGAAFLSASTQIPDKVSVDEWVDEAVGKYLPAGCSGPRNQQERITIDGELGRISDCFEDVVATVVVDRRLYLFMMAHSAPTRDEARQVFDAWVKTIDLTPETAAAP